MRKSLIITVIILIIIISGYNQYTLYQENDRLIELIERSNATIASHQKSYKSLLEQYRRVESYYEERVQLYIAISERDDKVIAMLEKKLEIEKEKNKSLLNMYNEVTENN